MYHGGIDAVVAVSISGTLSGLSACKLVVCSETGGYRRCAPQPPAMICHPFGMKWWAKPTLLLRGQKLVELGAELFDRFGVFGVFGEVGVFPRVLVVVAQLQPLLAAVPFGVPPAVRAE